jgi:hypothetical protein
MNDFLHNPIVVATARGAFSGFGAAVLLDARQFLKSRSGQGWKEFNFTVARESWIKGALMGALAANGIEIGAFLAS